MVEVNWTENAINDLIDIGDYIAKDSLKYSEITVQKLFIATDILETNPLAGKMVIEFEDEDLRELIRGNYRIVYYLVSDFLIDILTVQHCSMLLSNSSAFNEM